MRKSSILATIIPSLIILLVSNFSCNRSSSQTNPPPPGAGIMGAPWAEIDKSVNVTAGKATSLDYVYLTRKNGPGELSLVVFNIGQYFIGGVLPPELPMPVGLNVSVEPKQIRAYQNRTYHFNISINTSTELEPGTYWLAWRSSFESWGELGGPLTVTVEPAARQ